VSIRANTAVFKDCFFYEVTLMGDGLAQVGWCQLGTPFNSHNGVGDDGGSYAYDGNRVKRWNGSSVNYGEQWSTGDVIGSLIDLKNREISYWRNKKFLGVAFTGIEVGENMAYFPSVSLEKGMRVAFNFGLSPFSMTLNPVVSAINEPDCLINNYVTPTAILVEQFRNYVIAFELAEFKSLCLDERILVGSIILEYLMPLIADNYVFETLLMELFKHLLV
jgi:Kip1 ubiquitination-promoting complex protein 1